MTEIDTATEPPERERELDRDASVKSALAVLRAAGLDSTEHRKFRKEALRLRYPLEEINEAQKKLLDEDKRGDWQLGELKNSIVPYRTARLPVPEDKERELLSLEKRLSHIRSEFATGRKLLQGANEKYQAALSAARRGLAGTLATYCRGLGKQVRAAIEPDATFLLGHPERLPREVRNLQREAERVNQIANHLDGRRVNHVSAAFVSTLGEIAEAVLSPGPRTSLGDVGGDIRKRIEEIIF